MNVTFELLSILHFPFLLKWLEAPHIKPWWDKEVQWNEALIYQKYISYTQGYKLVQGGPKPIQAYIIYVDNRSIGYIQAYNAYDFARSKPLIGLPSRLAAFDIFIGETDYIGKHIGSDALQLFLNEKVKPDYSHVLADPENTNHAAIKAYEKAGFKKIVEYPDVGEVWMIKSY